MQELWQLYDEQGRPLDGQGAAKDEVFKRGMLHGASHVWIWRIANGAPEVLLQKRSATKRTWPNRYDISAAGHIDLGEDAVTAAVRETREEIGWAIGEHDLSLIAVHRARLSTGDATENEFQWIYLLQAAQHADFDLQAVEVSSVGWKTLNDFENETIVTAAPEEYVPHGQTYYALVCAAIRSQVEQISNP